MNKPKGQIKVELFCCDTGRKLHEVNNTNFISKGVEKAYEYVMRNLFTRNKAVGANEIAVMNPFYQMILTDNDKPEKPAEDWIVEGDTIGFALTTQPFSGNSATQGTINTAESFTKAEQVHLVFDFPTHAGNGTFQSIYFAPANLLFDVVNGYFNRGIGTVNSVQKYNGLLYAMFGSQTNATQLKVFDDDLNLIDTINLTRGATDFHIKDDVIFCVGANASDALSSWRSPLNSPSEITNLNLIPPQENGREYFGGITYDNATERWIISSAAGSSSSPGPPTSISAYDINFNLLDVVHLGNYTGGYGGIKLLKQKGSIVLPNYARLNPVTLVPGDRLNSNNLSGFLDNEHMILTNGYVVPAYLISSRVLLDAPVTKTNNVTMKITYDFMLPPLY